MIKLGQILAEQGALSEPQVGAVVEAQRDSHLPFGVLAERMFGLSIQSVETAWVEQYARFTGVIDLDRYTLDARALRLISRRQAWQFEMLPVRFEPEGDLLVAASRRRFARAVCFVAQRLEPVVFLRLAESQQLRRFLRIHYPMPEVSDELIQRATRMVA